MMTLSERCFKFIQTLGIPVTKFCRNINLSRTCLYDWKNGKIKLSDKTLERIENYIAQFGF